VWGSPRKRTANGILPTRMTVGNTR
jgi:hypothetical protein